MVYYHLVVVFCILAVISIRFVNIVLIKLVGEIWKHSHCFNDVGWTKEHKQSDDRSGYLTVGQSLTNNPENKVRFVFVSDNWGYNFYCFLH